VTGKFHRDYHRTLGIDISTYDAKIDPNLFKLLIWDLAGQDIFRDLRTRYCQGASGGIVVFDLTRPQTLESIPRWVEAFREAVGPEPLLILLGNKADLDNKRKITIQQGEKIAKDLGLFQYKETSAKTGQEVTTAFNTLAKMIHQAHKSRRGPP
jgi:small GTP-binding protein